MYEQADIDRLLAQTKGLLAKAKENPVGTQQAQQLVDDLREVILFHDYRYYIQSRPLIGDAEYDALYRMLRKLEDRFPELVSEDSPTRRVAGGLTKDFPEVRHLSPMLSLDNSYDENDLLEFDRRLKQLTGASHIDYCIEPKYDGTSISLVYENDRLVRGATRGDGVVGEDITPNVKALRTVPLRAAFSKHGIHRAEVRGEVVIPKDYFAEYNQQRMARGEAPLANPRNAASGTMRMQDAKEIQSRGLECVVYHLAVADDENGRSLLGRSIASRHQYLKILQEAGFKVPVEEICSSKGAEEIIQVCHDWEAHRDEFRYEIDGLVIKADDIRLEERAGTTSHHPRWAIAYKFSARQARTRLLGVEWQVGRIGTITPVAKLEPVAIGGVMVSSVSMFNEDFIVQKDIRVGDNVMVERAGDVIPYIAAVDPADRTGKEQPVQFPTHCPSCESELVRQPDEAAWRCININCPAQLFERLVHFVHKDAMDIPGMGRALVAKFIEMGWLRSVADIYRLSYERIEILEGFGKRSVEKLKEGIEQSKQRSISRLLFGLGIRHVGETTSKTLAETVHCAEELKNFTLEQLEALEDIGPKVAESIHGFFQNPDNLALIADLKEMGVQTCASEADQAVADGPLAGEVFLFTGGLATYTRPEASALVEKLGGKTAGSLSSKVTILVAGEEAGSKLDKARKMATVRIINEEEFLKLVE